MRNLIQNLTNKSAGLTLETPVKSDGTLTNYAKILELVANNPLQDGFTKRELLEYAIPNTFPENSTRTINGYYSNFFTMFSANEIINYDNKKKIWYAGKNFTKYYSENVEA